VSFSGDEAAVGLPTAEAPRDDNIMEDEERGPHYIDSGAPSCCWASVFTS